MPYRAFNSDDDQRAAEIVAPDRFNDGNIWRGLAESAITRGGAAIYDPSQWQNLIGGQALPVGERITAAQLWELFKPYEAERLQADWVTTEGVTALKEYQQQLYLELRAATDPTTVLGYRFALDIIEQALTDPDRRKNFIQLARAHDALGVQLYREKMPDAATPKYKSLKTLQPGHCVFIDDLPPSERTRIPYRGYYRRAWEGRWQICRATRIGFIAG